MDEREHAKGWTHMGEVEDRNGLMACELAQEAPCPANLCELSGRGAGREARQGGIPS